MLAGRDDGSAAMEGITMPPTRPELDDQLVVVCEQRFEMHCRGYSAIVAILDNQMRILLNDWSRSNGVAGDKCGVNVDAVE